MKCIGCGIFLKYRYICLEVGIVVCMVGRGRCILKMEFVYIGVGYVFDFIILALVVLVYDVRIGGKCR